MQTQEILKATPNTCTETYTTGTTNHDMIENYMSYADDDCMNTFTIDQRNRMWVALNLRRQQLWSSLNLAQTGVASSTGCMPVQLLSDIIPGSPNPCINTPQTFSNPTFNNAAVSWQWSVTPNTGVTLSSTTTSTITATFTDAGLYDITLEVEDVNSNQSTNTIQVFVSSCQIPDENLPQAFWAFGQWAALDFTSGVAIGASSSILTSESCASVSDEFGNPLFYTDGVRVWDNSHTVMSGGQIIPGSVHSNISANQGVLIVPNPSNYVNETRQYYVLTVPQCEFQINGNNNFHPLRFGIVDMDVSTTTNGDVISSNQTIPTQLLAPNVSEGLTAIPHCNGKDYWVITHPIDGILSGSFLAHLITEYGVSAVVQSSSYVIPPITANNNHALRAYFEAVRNTSGNILLAVSSQMDEVIRIYQFNDVTGQISLTSTISNPTGIGFCAATAFSESGEFLYVYKFGLVFQYRIGTQGQLLGLSWPIANVPPTAHFIEAIQRGPDNRIYFGVQGTSWCSVINAPNLLGNACNVQSSAIALPITNFSALGFPNMIDVPRPPLSAPSFTASPVSASCSTYHFAIDECWTVYEAEWDFGDGSATETGDAVNHTFTETGVYDVTLTLSINGNDLEPVVQQVPVVVPASAVTVNGTTPVCQQSIPSPVFTTDNFAGATYNWNPTGGTTSSTTNSCNVNFTATGSQQVNVTVTLNNCSATGTFSVNVLPAPTPTIAVVQGNNCSSWILTASGGVSYVWSHGLPAQATVTVTQPDTYEVGVTGANGCQASAETVLTVSPGCCEAPTVQGLTQAQQQALNVNQPMTSGQMWSQLQAEFPTFCDLVGPTGPTQNQRLIGFPHQIVINAPITLDGNFILRECPHVTFGQEGAIILNSPPDPNYTMSLWIEGSRLYACGDYMWKGISVNHHESWVWVYDAGTSGNLIHSFIEDAEHGIRATNGGNTEVENCRFNGNWIGMRIDGVPAWAMHLTGSVFANNNNGLKITPLNVYNSIKPDIGLFLNEVQANNAHLFTGDNSTSGNPNTFNGTNCGVYIRRSSARIYNCIFQLPNLQPLDDQTQYYGCGIFSDNIFLGNNDFRVRVGATGKGNIFDSGRVGIHHQGYSKIDIADNQFDRQLADAYISLRTVPYSDHVEITQNTNYGNTGNNSAFGIVLDNLPGSDVSVHGNKFEMSFQQQPAQRSIALLANNYNPAGTGRNIQVFNNEFHYTHLGVVSINTQNMSVHDNNIRLHPVSYDANSWWGGVVSILDRGMSIDHNYIDVPDGFDPGDIPAYTANANIPGKLMGILALAEQSATRVVCDSIVNMHWGIAAMGTNTGGINLSNNLMNTCEVGVAIANGGTIGDQGVGITDAPPYYPTAALPKTHDNKWYNMNTAILGVYNADGSNQRWFFRDGAYVNTELNPSTACNSVYVPSNPPGMQTVPYTVGLTQAAQLGNPVFRTFCANPNGQLYWCEQPYYPEFLAEPGGGGISDADYNSPQWYEKAATDSLSFPTHESDFKAWSKEQLYLFLEENQRFRDSSSVLDTFYLTYHDSAFAQLIRINLAFRTDSLDSATIEARIRDVNAIIASNIRDENMKTVNRIYLKYFAAMNFAVDSADSTALKNVADQCYIEGGAAVIEARSLYYSLTGNFSLQVDTNCPGNMFKNEQEVTVFANPAIESDYRFRMYPNPVNNQHTIVIESTHEGDVEFTDNLGRRILQAKFFQGYTPINFVTQQLPSGVYYYNAKLSNSVIEKGKLILLE